MSQDASTQEVSWPRHADDGPPGSEGHANDDAMIAANAAPPDFRVPELTQAAVAALVHDMDRRGFAVIEDYIQPADLARMQRFVTAAVSRSGGEYAGFQGADAVAGSGLDDLAASASFRDMVERIYRTGTGAPPPPQPFLQVLRCLSGQTTKVHSYIYHYDSYVVTALIPILIPTTGLAGDLLMLPNARRVRSHYILNAADKVLLDNRFTQWALRTLTRAGLLRITRIKMRPGNAYVFWGYRSIHANEPCSPDAVRATALFHYANPHAKTSPATIAARIPVMAAAP